MQISFDPMIHAEAQAVRKMLDGLASNAVTCTTESTWPARDEVSQDQIIPIAAPEQSAAPLAPPAPSTADAAPATNAQEVFEGFAATSASAPPVPSAPVNDAPSAPAAPMSPAGDVDSAGLPWDGRIHSESRNKVADGTWRKRRNTAPEVVTQVEAELRGSAPLAQPVPAAPTLAPSAPMAPASVPPAPPALAPAASASSEAPPLAPPAPAMSAPPIAPTPTPPVPPAPTAAADGAATTGIDFPTLMLEVNDLLNTRKVIGNDELNRALESVGVPAGAFVQMANTTPEKRLAFRTALQGLVPQ